jgi:hypothetical protein
MKSWKQGKLLACAFQRFISTRQSPGDLQTLTSIFFYKNSITGTQIHDYQCVCPQCAWGTRTYSIWSSASDKKPDSAESSHKEGESVHNADAKADEEATASSEEKSIESLSADLETAKSNEAKLTEQVSSTCIGCLLNQ